MNKKAGTKAKELFLGSAGIREILPGVILALIITVISYLLSQLLGNLGKGGINPFSPVLLAVVIGLLVKNLVRLPQGLSAGINFGVKKILRLGIMLMGIRLSIITVLEIGGAALGLVAGCILSAIVITIWLARRIKISSTLGMLIAAGTSICGVSAIVAVAPVVGAKEEETSYAVGVVTLFGIIATLLYPYLVELVLHFDVVKAGFFLGTAIHDTSQVTGASLIYDQLWGHTSSRGLNSSQIAVTTKLVRNTFLIGVIPLLGSISSRKNGSSEPKKRLKVLDYLPLFIFGYLLFGLARTLGDLLFGPDSAAWSSTCSFLGKSSTYIICGALACIGLSTDIKKMAKLGWKPMVVGLSAALILGVISASLVTVFSGFIRF